MRPASSSSRFVAALFTKNPTTTTATPPTINPATKLIHVAGRRRVVPPTSVMGASSLVLVRCLLSALLARVRVDVPLRAVVVLLRLVGGASIVRRDILTGL